MNKRSKVILISVLSVILGVVCLLTGRSLTKPVVPVQGAGETPTPTVVAYDPTKEEGTAQNPFTILEIVPNHTYAQIGFLIDGQEPVNVYGAGGILEKAQAGYKGAYEYLEKLTEFTVTGEKGEVEGTGSGSGGGGGSRTVYAFEDEKYDTDAEGNTVTWTKSEDKIERVIGYYSVATNDQKNNTGLMKYKLVQVATNNPYDTSGIDGNVYTANVLNGFEEKGYWDTGEYNKTDWVWPNTDNLYENNHYLEPGTSGENLKKYKREVKTFRAWGRDVPYYSYSRDDNGAYIYFSNDGCMYYQAYNGSYVGTYSEGYCVYQMVEAGTNLAGASGTYYVYNGPLGYEDNLNYINGVLDLDNSIWIAGTEYEYYVETAEEFYYTYTVEIVEVEYVFEDEKLPDDEYDAKGTKDRAGYYVVATQAEIDNPDVEKYEEVYATIGTDDWAVGLDGKKYSWSTKGFFHKSILSVTEQNAVTRWYDKPSGLVQAVDNAYNNGDNNKDRGSNDSRYKRPYNKVNSSNIIGNPIALGLYAKAYSNDYVYFETIPNGYSGDRYRKKNNGTYQKDSNGKYIYVQKDRYYPTSEGSYVYYQERMYEKNDEGTYVLYTDKYTVTKRNNFEQVGSDFYRLNRSGEYFYVDTEGYVVDEDGTYIRIMQKVTTTTIGKTYYVKKWLSYDDNENYLDGDTETVKDAYLGYIFSKPETYFGKKPKPTVTPTPAPTAIPTDGVTITHSNVFLKNVMNFAYQNNDPTKPLEIDQFEFAGWYTEPECINKYDFEKAVLNSNVTLYAKWIPKTADGNVFVDTTKYKALYSVKFFDKADATKESYIVENLNADLSLSEVTYVPKYAKAEGDKKDYLFLGWSKKTNGGKDDIITTVSYTDTTVNLYPVWKVMEVTGEKVMDVTNATAVEVTETHTVKFYVTKGDETSVVKTLEVYENGYIKPEEGVTLTDKYLAAMASFKPEAQSGKKFVGWYTESAPEFGKHVPYTFDKPVTENVKLYACWVDASKLGEIEFSVKFDVNKTSVDTLLLDSEKQQVEESSLYEDAIKYKAFKDGELAEVKPQVIRTPRLKGNVQYKASQYNIEVKTVLPSDLNKLSTSSLNELLDKVDMIVVSNSNHHASGDGDYSDIFQNYAKKRGGSEGYNGSNDLSYRVATAIFKKSMETGSAPVMLDKTLLNYRSSDDTARLNVYKLFVMLQAMDASMFYDSFLKADATNVSASELWTRISANGNYGGNTRWHCETFINALGLDSDEKIYYGIDKNQSFISGTSYPTSLTNHCYVYSGEVFSNGTKFTEDVIGPDKFYTNNMFSYFYGDDAEGKYEGKVCAPADAVNYMVFGYQPEVGLDETTAILELQPEHTFKDFKYWYLFVKKYMPNYSGKLIVECKDTQKTFYLGNAVNDNCETLTVRQIGSLEFVGLITDLNSDYRMIYIGGDLSRDNSAEMEIGGNYYAYLHTGNVADKLEEKVLGVLGGDTDTESYSCYPGNDITEVKMRELYDYCAKAHCPIIIDKSLFSNVGTNTINTNLMDSSSNLYQLFTNATNGLLGTAPCYAEGNVGYNTMYTLMNEDRVRLLTSSVPPTYKEGQGDSLNYLNPMHQESRILEYKFVLQGKKDTDYKVRLYIDMNADGQFNPATELLDSLVIRTGKTILSNHATLKAGQEYTVQRSISDYVGVMPWKLEVYEVSNESVRHSVTGMTAIKPVKKNAEGTDFEKEKLNILQVTSAKGGLNKYGENNAYMPTSEEMEALDALGDTYKGKKYSELSNTQKNTVNGILDKVSSSGSNRQIAYDFWVYLSSLKDFDISITRVSLTELANGIATGHHNGVDFKVDNFNMLIMGFADCYNEITDEASLVAVEDFIESGKSVLFTHDCSSFFNYSEQRATKDSFYTNNSGISYWGYNINKRFRNMLGMDRYGVTLMYGNETKLVTGFDFNNNVTKSSGTQYTLYTTSLMGTLSDSGFVVNEAYKEIAQEMEKKDTLYKYNTNQKKLWMNSSGNKAYVQGYSRLLLKDDDNGVEGYTSTKVSNVNAGQITKYPYTIPESFTVASTHSQYYQLDLEANDIVVWYCLANDSGVFNQFYNDARNNYYIYSKGNIMYTGVGHSGGLSENEIKLFINTMVAAYAASADPTAPKIINFDRTTGVDEIDYLYVDYDTTFPELAIGEGVDGDRDAEGNLLPTNQTKEVNFKLTENSIVTNKLMTVYVYNYISKDAEGNNIYDPLPMEMEVRKYTSADTTVLAEGNPVFVVNIDRENTTNPEYTYTKGQVLAIDSNIMVQTGSINGTTVKIGGNTYTMTRSGNGFYYDYNGNGVWDTGDAISYNALVKLDDDGLPVYSTTEVISGYIYMAPVVNAGEEYMFKAPIAGLVDKDMVPYKLHVNLRYGKRQDKTKDGFKELSVVRRGLFNLD